MRPLTKPARTLIGLLLLGLVARVLWGIGHALVIENEGAEYARIAENLLRGRGYLGLLEMGPQLNFPPLYPLLIAILAVPLRSSELAARTVSLAAGLLVIAAVHLIATRLYGRRVGILAGVLAALHPLLVALSVSAYAEGLALALNLLGIYLVLVAADGESMWAAWLAGCALGLAYLARPEAFVYAAALGVALLVTGLLARRLRAGLRQAAALLVAFTLVASPYIAFLAHYTGHVRLEGKGSINYAIGERMLAGEDYLQAGYEVTDDLREVGVHLRPNAAVLAEQHLRPGGLLRYMLDAAPRNLSAIYQLGIDSRAFGSPVLLVLAVLGVLGAAWSAERLRGELVLLAFGGSALAVLLTVQHLDFRNFFPLLVLLLIWAGRGLDHIGSWVSDSSGSVLGRVRGARLVSGFAAGSVLLALLAFSFLGVGDVSEFSQARAVNLRRAGLWIRSQAPKGAAVMDGGTVVSYYAGLRLEWLPFASSETALRYLDFKRPDYVIVRVSGTPSRPYLKEWIERGIPSPHAVLVREFGASRPDGVRVYRWSAGD